jgi:hypothetical protein
MKIIRFTVLFVMGALLAFIMYVTIPAFVWVLGGSFQAVAHNPFYATIAAVTAICVVGRTFEESFDNDFRPKS